MVLDEATSALDQGNVGVVVKRVVRGLAERGVGVVVITHDERVVGACEEVVVIGERGRGPGREGWGSFWLGGWRSVLGEGWVVVYMIPLCLSSFLVSSFLLGHAFLRVGV